MIIQDYLNQQFNTHVRLREVRPNIQQVLVPLYHEDGDMVDLFIDETPGSDRVKVSDHGLTLMRMSYDYDVDTDTRRRILQQVLRENQIDDDEGRLFIETSREGLYPAIMQLAHVLAKVSGMRFHTRELVRSMFIDDLRTIVLDQMEMYSPVTDISPLDDQPEVRVDFKLEVGRKPLYLFGVTGVDRARIVALTCQALIIADHIVTCWVVHEDFERMQKREMNFLTRVVGKQFTSLDDFRRNRNPFLRAQAA